MTDVMTTTPARNAEAQAGTARGWRPPAWLRNGGPAVTGVGIAAAVAGFSLILLGWGQVAGERTVARQIPHLVAAGVTGLALVLVGLVVIDVAARRQDARARHRQSEQLIEVLAEIKAAVRSDVVASNGVALLPEESSDSAFSTPLELVASSKRVRAAAGAGR